MLAFICIIVTIFPCEHHRHIIAIVKQNLTQIPLKLIFSSSEEVGGHLSGGYDPLVIWNRLKEFGGAVVCVRKLQN